MIRLTNLYNEIMKLTSKEKGNLTELQCITAIYSLGYKVSIPYGENCRYDFILDIDNKLLRVQVKTASLVEKNDPSAIHFSTRSTRGTSSKVYSRSYNKKEIDYFATYWDNKCYLIPVEETAKTYKNLRFSSNSNNKTISWAENYELEKQIQKIIGE